MDRTNRAEALTNDLESLVKARLGAIFQKYAVDIKTIISPLKWKPLVLVIGNYSSGKSTFINELLGTQIQRTGQAPTDDSFTILTSPGEGEAEGEVPGATLVTDDRLPFAPLRRFGESLLSHLRLKKVRSPVLEDLAIIDTPGMLDSVTEKDRGYDYLGVVGELARMADVILLMFDPHKAGTIKETYQAIRTTLPGTVGEDRVIYVLNRIDECENIADLVRSYGTLCWNLSQMTGRKDMPRIYLTFAPHDDGKIPPELEIWVNEREELKDAVKSAPRMRLFHIINQIDLAARELGLEVEALSNFKKGFIEKLKGILKTSGLIVLVAFFLGDALLKLLTGYPETTFIESLFSGNTSTGTLIWPLVWALVVIAFSTLYVQKIQFPQYVKKVLQKIDSLVVLDTDYKRDLWSRVKKRVDALLRSQAKRQIWIPHARYLKKINNFLEQDLKQFCVKVKGLKSS